jgi:hypothetical protein
MARGFGGDPPRKDRKHPLGVAKLDSDEVPVLFAPDQLGLERGRHVAAPARGVLGA